LGESCPPVNPDHFGICVMQCQPGAADSCSQGEKCCHNGCGFTCQTVIADKEDVTSPAKEETMAALLSSGYDGCPKRTDFSGSCSGDMCPVMDCRTKCCFDGCSSFCVDEGAGTNPTWNPRPSVESCPMKEPSGGFGCQENLCPVMRCNNQCCYDGCKSFCRNDGSEPFPVAVNDGPDVEKLCPMKEPTGGFGCMENLCPVMRCNPRCCYDGCRSYCQAAKYEATNDPWRADSYSYNSYDDFNYNPYVKAGATLHHLRWVSWVTLLFSLAMAYYH